jgi:hypothetical protein
MRKILVLTILTAASFILPAARANAQSSTSPILIYGTLERGQGIVFLGCTNCNSMADESLFNRIGDYGSQVSDMSIYNRIGDYGSQISNVSACNRNATDPPVVVQDGQVLGWLSMNRRLKGYIFDPRMLNACR